ncbi:hypothetical protein Glove_99g47 [Diversispora epigaea]|uniref:Protein kinase domain-containing protein n=1 Tax=Diversispora epigaea TaxID=1348612 RepID=A0A397J498_9GLOM|nr:hypothetical protein Glove_99g47 [Diversispora epigaea]
MSTHSFYRRKSRAYKTKTGSLISSFNGFARFGEEFIDYGECLECGKKNTGFNWCQSCNSKHFRNCFLQWSSGNREIDKFIRNSQIFATSRDCVLDWIPYNQLTSFRILGRGGFGIVQRATWLEGQIDQIIGWNYLQRKWERHGRTRVSIKVLDNSRDIKVDYFHEMMPIFGTNSLSEKLLFHHIRYLGITRNPATQKYAIVMQYIEQGNLRNYLEKNYSIMNWERKLFILQYVAKGLKILHEADIIHRNLHSGNILIHNNLPLISDTGMCRPANKLVQSDKNEIYGVIPFMAPELLKTGKYSKETDIYSFGLIIWEICANHPPLNEHSHDTNLAMDICLGERPPIPEDTPKSLITLIKSCLDAIPENRPSVAELFNNLNSWYLDLSQINRTEYYFEYKLADRLRLKGLNKCSKKPFVKNHPEACYRSRLLNFPNLPKPINDKFGDVKLSLENFMRVSTRYEDADDDSNEEISDVEEYLDDLIERVKAFGKSKEIFKKIDNSTS